MAETMIRQDDGTYRIVIRTDAVLDEADAMALDLIADIAGNPFIEARALVAAKLRLLVQQAKEDSGGK